jgi:phosphate transport system protein
MQRHFDKELDALKARLLHMGAIAEGMIEEAIRGLVERREVEKSIMSQEEEVNDLQIAIDENVVELIALHHPVAEDLRFLIMASKINGELERIADQAMNIAQNTSYLLRTAPLKLTTDLPLMADTARHMLRLCLDAFMKRDTAAAEDVLNTDDKVDGFKDRIFKDLLTGMMADPATIPRAVAVVLIARNLERVGDHATNIAEEVIYLTQGRDVRHHHEEEKRQVEKL